MEDERQWPSVWYFRDDKKGTNPLRGSSGTPIGGTFTPDDYRIWVGQAKQLADLKTMKKDGEWNITTVGFLIWPRASWAALEPNRYWRWFFTRKTLPENERALPQAQWDTSILAGKGEWSRAEAVIGWRKKE